MPPEEAHPPRRHHHLALPTRRLCLSPGLAAESIIVKIGENVVRLSEATVVANPQVPWSNITRMRDRLAHHCEATDYDAVRATISVDLPRMRAAIASLLADAPPIDHSSASPCIRPIRLLSGA